MGTWKRFSNLAHEQLPVRSINKLLRKFDELGWEFVWTREPAREENINYRVYIKYSETEFYMCFKTGGKVFVKWCYLDGRPNDSGTIQGKRAYAIMAQYYKAPHVNPGICSKYIDGKPNYDVLSSSPIIWCNPAFERKRVGAICYDKNSAYGCALEGLMPDTSKGCRYGAIVGENDIGFVIDSAMPTVGWGRKLRLAKPGTVANFVFPAMPSPYKRFVDVWFREKKNAKSKDERNKAKNIINEAIGYLQLVNPFIRATVVERCNQNIRALMDENTIYCNTDCICSAVPRPDIPIGKELGLFKIEHQGEVAIRGNCYQWNDEIPTYRGVPKSRFKQFEKENGRKWDITKDEIPEMGGAMRFDPITRRIV